MLNKLAAFKPDIITIEMESSEECDLAARHPAKYGTDYCPSTQAAQAAAGLDVPAALAQIDETLKTWPAQATPAQRRHLAALFMAANDQASAYVQWLQLTDTQGQPSDGLDAALVGTLNKLTQYNNENYQIAARLAARLGLQRVHAVDNHTGDQIDVPDKKALVRALEAAWVAGGAALKALKQQQDALQKANDLLPLYRALNTPGSLRAHAEANIVGPMRAKSSEGDPQLFVGGWEIRNPRIVGQGP